MGCSSSVPVQPQPTHNGHVVKSSPPGTPPAQQRQQEPQQQPPPQQQERNRKDSVSSKSSSASSKSSKSSKSNNNEKNRQSSAPQAAESEEGRPASPGRPVTAPGGEADNTDGDQKPTAESEAKPKEDEDGGSEKPNFDEGALKEYVELENKIREAESKDLENGYKTKHDRLVELYKSIGESRKQVEILRQQTQKEYQDVVSITTNYSVRSLFENQSRLDAEVRKEQQEYVDAFNRQEVAEQRLKAMGDQYQQLHKEVGTLKAETDELGKLRFKQEELLGKIFNNCYGSEREYELELELDSLGDQKERIQGASHRWNGAKVYSEAACKQFAWSARRWLQIYTIQNRTVMITYQMVAETRNCLVAASRNMSSIQGMLAPVQVPYVTKEDTEALQSAIGTIFNDVNIPDKFNAAYQVFFAQYTKSAHLLQWIQKVLTERISKDQQDVNKKFHQTYFELKKERMTLIQAAVKEKLGIELEIDLKEPESSEEEAMTSTSQTDIAQPEVVAKEEGDEQAPDADEQEGAPPATVPTEEGAAGEAPAEGGSAGEQEPGDSKAVPLDELAPPPSEADLFGDIEDLKKKHEEEMAEFQKNQELNRARQEQGLQEKLRARRSRRRKIQLQEVETQQLTGESDSTLPPPTWSDAAA